MAKRYDSKRRVLRKGESERKDGMYVYRVMRDGKNIMLSDTSLAGLRKKEEELNKKLEAGVDMDKQSTTLNELADKYLGNKAKTVQETTFHTMTNMYDNYVRNELGKRVLATIKSSTIKEFYLYLMDRDKPIGIKTLQRLDSILKPMLDSAVKDDIIIKNPAFGVMGEIKAETKSRAKKVMALTEEEQDEFVKYIINMKKHKFVKNLIIYLIGSGCRVGEVIGLTWNDVDFDKNVVHINHAVGYIKKDGKYRHVFKEPKSVAGNRTIPMLGQVREALLDQKDLQKIMGLEQPVMDGYTDFVFLSEVGTVFTRENISAQIRQIIDEHNNEHPDSELPKFTTHQLRHNFATRLCKSSSDLKAIQYILGHTDISLTMNTYADATASGVMDSMAALEGIVFKEDDKDDDSSDSGVGGKRN